MEQIRALLDSSVMAVDYIQSVIDNGDDDPVIAELLDNLRQIAALIEAETQGGTDLLHHVHLYGKNIQASLDEIQRDRARFGRVFSLEVRPFILEMVRLWRIIHEILPHEENRRYHQEQLMQQMKALHSAPRETYRYDASIVLFAFNKLEYTKKAIESIFAHTDFSSGKVELITVNNGSNDGTREYFESLPHAKNINLKHNILGVNSAQHIVEGKYYIGYANDVIATPHWLDHLLAAMEADDRVAFAVPTCNEESVSNFQGIPVSYPNTFEGMDAMQEFACSYNHLNPGLWEERSQLMPFLSITRTDVYKMGLVDPIYTRGEFVDDDLSTLLRRTGWRQLLLKDTFMHHFGSVTLGEARMQAQSNSVVEMRHVYYKKWGVDAWDSRCGFPEMEPCLQWRAVGEKERVLILEPRFGDIACVIKNEYQKNGSSVHMCAAVFDSRYREDTNTFFNEMVTANTIEELHEKPAYNLISAGCYLDELAVGDVIGALEKLYSMLAPGGMLLLPVRNCSSAYEIWHLLGGTAWEPYEDRLEVKRFTGIHIRRLLEVLEQHPLLCNYRIHHVSYASDAPTARVLTEFLQAVSNPKSDMFDNLAMRTAFLGIFKPTA